MKFIQKRTFVLDCTFDPQEAINCLHDEGEVVLTRDAQPEILMIVIVL